MRQMDSHRTVGRDGLYMGLSFDKIPGMIFQDGLVFQGHGISLARIKLSLFEEANRVQVFRNTWRVKNMRYCLNFSRRQTNSNIAYVHYIVAMTNSKCDMTSSTRFQ
ncbi:uncharacterized protein [Physcomitrium patens]|uniref:uncharacterized protein isoform X3 n=1 Tax=Physcomitrium patens TaxID=3218 RepID=UPI000D16B5DA|nr:uncharacterized protein LOC112277430 isoform X3 [Physcomitrium patens]XP_024365478.1 uncharacterized protein LOC112277430 isoform X3 [Physcomitrium patens]XP_024365479.1 uncharacterized protein LOC112277430 isoform X3 [Physcomitrium patens]|eukprot:XP_024365477.1 uncharacterized protein LOC112277430 isoform X3 [Physcomitrella patens]